MDANGLPISRLPAAGALAGGDLMVVVQPAGGGLRETRKVTFSGVVGALGALGGAPVQSVNGKIGAVVIAQADIPGLVAALSAKADAGHTHTSQDITDLAVVTDGGQY